MKILVCGKGPSILKQLNGRPLNNFDKIVKVNGWEIIPEVDNRCDAWVYYPLHAFGNPERGFENKYDVTKFFEEDLEYWIAHEFTVPTAEKQLNRKPDYILTDKMRDQFYKESGLLAPRTGILALHMAMLLEPIIWACGFDFYQGGKDYYFQDKNEYNPGSNNIHPCPLQEKEWFDKQVKKGRIKIL